MVDAMVNYGMGYNDSGIMRFGRDYVQFQDGSKFECDVVLLCTGYRYQNRSKAQDGSAATTSNKVSGGPPTKQQQLLQPKPRQLYARMIDPELGLAVGYVGFHRPAIGSIPQLSEMTARYFAGLVTGPLKLPTRMETSRLKRRGHSTCGSSHSTPSVGTSPMQHCWSLFFFDPPLWWALLTKQHNAFHYRLYNSDGCKSPVYDDTRTLLLSMPGPSKTLLRQFLTIALIKIFTSKNIGRANLLQSH